MSAYLDEATKAMRMCLEHSSAQVEGKCESPIEVGLLQGFIALQLINRQFRIEGLRLPGEVVSDYDAHVLIQHKIGDFRTDFAVHLTGSKGGKRLNEWIAVECDGHEFHERTKEQAARNKARDRAITTAGYKILRFTGSEIYRSSFACATDVYLLVRKIIEEWEAE